MQFVIGNDVFCVVYIHVLQAGKSKLNVHVISF